MSLVPAVFAVLPALKPPSLAPVADTGIRDATNTDLYGLVDDLRRQMTAAHPALVATTPIPYTKGRRP